MRDGTRKVLVSLLLLSKRKQFGFQKSHLKSYKSNEHTAKRRLRGSAAAPPMGWTQKKRVSFDLFVMRNLVETIKTEKGKGEKMRKEEVFADWIQNEKRAKGGWKALNNGTELTRSHRPENLVFLIRSAYSD